jgi:hypothetical protein
MAGGADLGPAHLRVARPTDDLEAVVRFYHDGLGLEVLFEFKDHDGFDGVRTLDAKRTGEDTGGAAIRPTRLGTGPGQGAGQGLVPRTQRHPRSKSAVPT